ncbi:MAG: hypothetical protein J7484_08145 [Microbacterium sp.]|nr:hypothetical protein [Microbacterium sp.]
MCSTSDIEIWTWSELRAESSRRSIERLVAAGGLERLRRGVYATPTACADAREAASHGGSLGCESAARHLGLWVLDTGDAHVWMRGHRHHQGDDASGCHCIRHWDDGPSASTFELPSVPRILLQIYRCRGTEAFFVALESARRLGLLSTAGLRWLRGVIDQAGQDLIDFSRADADSGLESLVRLRLRPFGWDVRTQCRIVGTGRVDLLVDGWLIIETDGRDNHDESSFRHRDLTRDANSASWGHVSLRFDYALVLHDWDLAERAIVATMSLRP